MNERDAYMLCLLVLRNRGKSTITPQGARCHYADNVLVLRWWADSDELWLQDRCEPGTHHVLKVRETKVMMYSENEEVTDHLMRLVPLEALALL